MKAPVRVAVTGAAGQIGYALLFRIAAGDMLGPDQPVILHLLEITPALPALQGVVMELNDCAFPTLAGVVATDDLNVAFKDVDYALRLANKLGLGAPFGALAASAFRELCNMGRAEENESHVIEVARTRRSH